MRRVGDVRSQKLCSYFRDVTAFNATSWVHGSLVDEHSGLHMHVTHAGTADTTAGLGLGGEHTTASASWLAGDRRHAWHRRTYVPSDVSKEAPGMHGAAHSSGPGAGMHGGSSLIHTLDAMQGQHLTVIQARFRCDLGLFVSVARLLRMICLESRRLTARTFMDNRRNASVAAPLAISNGPLRCCEPWR